MRHHRANRKFGLERNQRRALLRSLAIALIEREKITTSDAKAREIRPFVEKLVTVAKKQTVAAHKLVVSRLGGSKKAASKLVKTMAVKYVSRKGGYTRITKLPSRLSDGSKMAQIEFV